MRYNYPVIFNIDQDVIRESYQIYIILDNAMSNLLASAYDAVVDALNVVKPDQVDKRYVIQMLKALVDPEINDILNPATYTTPDPHVLKVKGKLKRYLNLWHKYDVIKVFTPIINWLVEGVENNPNVDIGIYAISLNKLAISVKIHQADKEVHDWIRSVNDIEFLTV